jgi:chromosome partitioning protein
MKRNAIAVMNTKGGVGKSTVVLGLAETLSAFYRLNVLVIDSDAQASISYMLAGPKRLTDIQAQRTTIVGLLDELVMKHHSADWRSYVMSGVSDVDDARTVYLIPGDTELTLFERAVSKGNAEANLRRAISNLLLELRGVFDVVLIDCPPGLSVVTESWLREADYYLSPTRPDFISACGLAFLRRFKARNPEMGFATNLGVLVAMRDPRSTIEGEFDRWLRADPENNCFQTVIPRTHAMQFAATFTPDIRSYGAKYPAEAGDAIRNLTQEVLARLAGEAASEPQQAKQSV